ncbi:MAG: 30S ribosomal protein S16 [Pirellulales bacterium]
MAVRIRLKRMGRAHRPFYRVCAIDRHSPRDGRVLEELGTYDTSIADTDARAILKNDRVDYWLSVGAQPSDRCAVLIKKYGTDGTHAEIQHQAMLKLAEPRQVPAPGTPASLPKKAEEAKTEEPAAKEAKTEEPAAKEAKAEKPAAKEAKAEKPAAKEAKAEKPTAKEAKADKPAAGAKEAVTKEAEPEAKDAEPAAKAAETTAKVTETTEKASEESKS